MCTFERILILYINNQLIPTSSLCFNLIRQISGVRMSPLLDDFSPEFLELTRRTFGEAKCNELVKNSASHAYQTRQRERKNGNASADDSDRNPVCSSTSRNSEEGNVNKIVIRILFYVTSFFKGDESKGKKKQASKATSSSSDPWWPWFENLPLIVFLMKLGRIILMFLMSIMVWCALILINEWFFEDFDHIERADKGIWERVCGFLGAIYRSVTMKYWNSVDSCMAFALFIDIFFRVQWESEDILPGWVVCAAAVFSFISRRSSRFVKFTGTVLGKFRILSWFVYEYAPHMIDKLFDALTDLVIKNNIPQRTVELTILAVLSVAIMIIISYTQSPGYVALKAQEEQHRINCANLIARNGVHLFPRKQQHRQKKKQADSGCFALFMALVLFLITVSSVCVAVSDYVEAEPVQRREMLSYATSLHFSKGTSFHSEKSKKYSRNFFSPHSEKSGKSDGPKGGSTHKEGGSKSRSDGSKGGSAESRGTGDGASTHDVDGKRRSTYSVFTFLRSYIDSFGHSLLYVLTGGEPSSTTGVQPPESVGDTSGTSAPPPESVGDTSDGGVPPYRTENENDSCIYQALYYGPEKRQICDIGAQYYESEGKNASGIGASSSEPDGKNASAAPDPSPKETNEAFDRKEEPKKNLTILELSGWCQSVAMFGQLILALYMVYTAMYPVCKLELTVSHVIMAIGAIVAYGLYHASQDMIFSLLICLFGMVCILSEKQRTRLAVIGLAVPVLSYFKFEFVVGSSMVMPILLLLYVLFTMLWVHSGITWIRDSKSVFAISPALMKKCGGVEQADRDQMDVCWCWHRVALWAVSYTCMDLLNPIHLESSPWWMRDGHVIPLSLCFISFWFNMFWDGFGPGGFLLTMLDMLLIVGWTADMNALQMHV